MPLRSFSEIAREIRRNPAADVDPVAARFEDFHGRPATEELVIESEEREHLRLSDVGELVELVVLAPGKRSRGIRITHFRGARLTMNAAGTQLYIEGGDQSVDVADFDILHPHEKEVLGPIAEVKYHTDKHHLGSEGGDAIYHHEFGEDGGELPTLNYDVRNRRLHIVGGSYKIRREGIEN